MTILILIVTVLAMIFTAEAQGPGHLRALIAALGALALVVEGVVRHNAARTDAAEQQSDHEYRMARLRAGHDPDAPDPTTAEQVITEQGPTGRPARDTVSPELADAVDDGQPRLCWHAFPVAPSPGDATRLSAGWYHPGSGTVCDDPAPVLPRQAQHWTPAQRRQAHEALRPPAGPERYEAVYSDPGQAPKVAPPERPTEPPAAPPPPSGARPDGTKR